MYLTLRIKIQRSNRSAILKLLIAFVHEYKLYIVRKHHLIYYVAEKNM